MDARRAEHADTTADRGTDTTEATGGPGGGETGAAADGGAAGLPDLTGLDFADLEAMPESVLRAALRRVLADGGAPSRFAAFQNSL
ncbi:FxSxx-COOH cyclophane-containing RiPP peptide [Actinokineospora spheciospongiae]|uniref:FxSxx-COOH cyclophane-containing RiPP peptide n=1 Tax=Actinokineospora spheciospongiae TaxID=909613 RepID=UPI000D71629C|nr:FxSxx-COOH cyclophane-containing RiPP peptide [Actinokineospora spheciospongiae]PWW63572.1 FXSXX-COOH protein [Actinokineospora spheciospongiae]